MMSYLLQYRTIHRGLLSQLIPIFIAILFGIGCDSAKDSSGGSGFSGSFFTSGGAGSVAGAIGNVSGGTLAVSGSGGNPGSIAASGSGGNAGSVAVSGSGGNAGSVAVSGSGGTSGIMDSGVGGSSDGAVVNVGGSGGGAGTATSGTGGSTTTDCQPFSFFVTSLEAMQRESGSQDGFGGDLGGLTGADDLCRRIAVYVLECAGNKEWRAFLSTSTEDAIDRVGQGPWYDILGRTVALSVADLANTRPANADPEIANDLPNEYGTPNHAPDGTQVDNHDTLTGSNAQGRYVGSANATCNDWTSSEATGRPQIGHSWPGGPSQNWIEAHSAPGCAPGVNLSDRGGPGEGSCVGCSGGYGGIYCFARQP